MDRFVLSVFIVTLCAFASTPHLAAAQTRAAQRVTTFANPLDIHAADPDVLLDDGVYYLYATSRPGRGFTVWSSRDLVHWLPRGLAFDKTQHTWAQRDFWAPSVVKSGDRYLLYYNAQPKDAPAGSARAHRICVAEADNPLGPFKDVAAPLFDPGDMAIDADVFIDRDGKGYLYYANGSIWMVPLDASLTRTSGDPAPCLEPSQPWERKWNEAPLVIRHKDKYVMFYSAPGYDMPEYSVAYAVADSPTGPWAKPHGLPILSRTPAVSGPGHNTVTTSPDGSELFMVYHTHQRLAGGDPRQIAIDRMRIVDDPTFGIRVEVDGPTTLSQSLPSGATGPRIAASDEFDTESIDRDRWMILNEDPGSWRLDNGKLVITTLNGNVWGNRADLRNVFLQTPAPSDFEVVTYTDYVVRQGFDQASLLIWQDHNNYIRLSNVYSGGRRWQIVRELGGETFSEQLPNTIGDRVWMKITRRGRTYSCSVSVDGKAWWPVGPPLAADFSEVRVGIAAASPGGGRKADAAFEFFRISTPAPRAAPALGNPTAPRR
jgi:beta-xylosidase